MDKTAPPISRAAWGTLIILTLIYACHAIDRAVMSIVAELVKEEFKLSDTQIGVLSGLSYAMVYALVGIPIGYLVDRVNRRNLLCGILTTWSFLTLLCGFATSYWQLLFARMAVGGAEAGGAPTSISIISDLFPAHRRSSAISIFWFSTALGTALSFAIGGFVTAKYGWRTTFFVAGAPGLLLAILLPILVKEPKRGAMEIVKPNLNDKAPTLKQTFKFVLAKPAVIHIFIAIVLNGAVLSGVLIWSASYLIRVHNIPIGHAGLIIGGCIAIFGGLGSLIGGFLGDFIHKRLGIKGLPIVSFMSSLITTLMVVAFSLATNSILVIVFFAIFEIVSRIYTAPSYSFLITNIEPRMRGVIVSSLQVGANLIGYGLGPFVVGLVSDIIGGEDSIRYGLLCLVPISMWVSLHFYLAYRSVRNTNPQLSTQ